MTAEKESNRFLESMQLPVALVLILLIIHLLKEYTNYNFNYWGIFPRKIYGLKGIITGPLVHGDWKHLFSNSLSLLSLLAVCMYFYRIVAVRGTVMIWILTGAAVWLLGNFFDDSGVKSSHIGISGVVYGLVAFVFWNGIFVKSRESIVLALVVLVLYGGLFEGIFPNQEGNISWESHMFGGLIGIFTAYYYKDDLLEEVERLKNINRTWADEFRPSTLQNGSEYFLPRDIFEKTKEQRKREQDYYDEEGL